MAKVSYFQTYSQEENVVTNNCLLALKHFYEIDPTKLDNILEKILDVDEIGLGVKFKQQVHTHGKADKNKSILDGFVGQEPFRIYIETKMKRELDYGQIERHIENISNLWAEPRESNSYLLGLVKGLENPERSGQVEKMKKIAEVKGIRFVRTTFARLLGVMKEEIKGYKAYDPRLEEIIEDFEDFLAGQELLPSNVLVSLNAKHTLPLNVKHGLYYDGTYPDGSDYPDLEEAKFMGLYRNKTIECVGEIESWNVKYNGSGHGDDSQKRIHDFIESIENPEVKEQTKSFKFHLVKKIPVDDRSRDENWSESKYFYPANFKKISSGGQRGRRYFFRWKWITECENAKELASKLNGLEYESKSRLVEPRSPKES